MQRIILILACVLLLPMMMLGQRGKNGQVEKELMEYKLKFLSQEMELEPSQQQKFVEVYTRMMTEKRRVFAAAVESENRVKKDPNASAKAYEQANAAMAQAKIQEGKIDKKYDAEFRKFLTPKQIYKMKEGEEKFRKMLKEVRGKKRR